MTRLGATPNRCHSYDTTNSAAYQKAKFVYICSCRKHAVGPTVHKKIQKGHRYTCNKCKSELNFVKSAGRVSVKEALKA
jgi:predicted SprT family Zn-dependent metalloprotease